MGRKVTLAEGLKEAIANLIIVYICYGLINWESNPFKWDPVMKVFALFMACIYFPYRDNKRWERDKDKAE